MPMPFKAWKLYPPDTSTPITDAALKALESRVGNYVGAVTSVGAGVDNYESFRVKQHGAGDMTVDVGLANTLMGGYIALDALGTVERYEYNNAQLNQAISAADPANPRLDQIVLVPGATDSQAPTTAVVLGTPTGGATLENRSGAAALPAARIRLADVLVGAAATQILTANIRDRRQFAIQGASPMAPNTNGPAIVPPIDMVPLVPHQLAIGFIGALSASYNNFQIATAVYLPRRITATKIRWAYAQGGTQLTGNFNWGIYDSSGTLIVSTGAIAFAGAINSFNIRNETIASTTFEAGWYHQVLSLASLVGGPISYQGTDMTQSVGGGQMAVQNMAYLRSAGGTALPNNFIVGALQDMFILGAVVLPGMPNIALSAA